MFRLLGLLAALNLRLNRIRINFVPLNLAVAGLLVWGMATGLTRIAEGPSDAVPRTVTVADLAAGRVASGSFVRVSGFVQPGLLLGLGKMGSGGKLKTVEQRLRLLHDADVPAVWVQVRWNDPDSAQRKTFVGIVRPLPTAARQAALAQGGKIEGRAPATGALVEDGAQPRGFVSGVVRLVVCAPPLALLACVWVRRGQIFRRGQRTAFDVGSPYDLIEMRFSGRLRLDGRTAGRFVEVGAELRGVEGGGVAVVAAVDASTYVMGLRAIARDGLWTLPIPAGAALSIVVGEMAFGTDVRPAARVDVSVGGRVVDQMTLSFGNLSQRERVLQMLACASAANRAAAAA